jgi:hypothetical protein
MEILDIAGLGNTKRSPSISSRALLPAGHCGLSIVVVLAIMKEAELISFPFFRSRLRAAHLQKRDRIRVPTVKIRASLRR